MIGETTVLVTGKRGNGKSLKAIGMMQAEIAEGRPTFASNFNGLNVPGVQVLDDPRQWETLPAGSILFVDEAQRFWRSRRTGDPAPEVQAMETQRHAGVTIVLLTQQPTYLDKHIRGLVDLHHHLVIEVGGKASRVYTWKRCIDDCEEASARDTADMSVFLFPKADFSKYASAEVHTIKPKLPRKLKFIVGAVVVVGLLFWFALGKFNHHPDPAAGASAAGDATEQGPSSDRAMRAPRGLRYADAGQYADALRPRIPEVAWTAPAFDGREVASDPHVYCIASGQGGQDGCTCLTEQGTRYAMDLDKCVANARYGEPYNPFKAPADARRGGSRGAASSAPAAPASGGAGGIPPAVDDAAGVAPVAPASGSAEPVAAYGWFRDQKG